MRVKERDISREKEKEVKIERERGENREKYSLLISFCVFTFFDPVQKKFHQNQKKTGS